MMKKEFKHNEIEKCSLCKKEINTVKEKFVVLIDYDKLKQYSLGFYHLICLKERINAGNKVQEQIEDIKGWGENLIRQVTGKEKVVNF